MIVTRENGIESRETVMREGFTVADVYYPNTCPWDYYGRKWLREMELVLAEKDIESQQIEVQQKNLIPMGSGPNGRVRFGDGMMPGCYKIAVPAEKLPEALDAIRHHQIDIKAWLDGDDSMPEILRKL